MAAEPHIPPAASYYRSKNPALCARLVDYQMETTTVCVTAGSGQPRDAHGSERVDGMFSLSHFPSHKTSHKTYHILCWIGLDVNGRN